MMVLVIVVRRVAMMRFAMMRLPSLSRLPHVRLRKTLLESFKLVQHLIAVEGADVSGLDGRKPAHRPGEVHEVRLDGMRERMHPDLLGKPITLPRITRAARRDDVRPIVRATA